MIRIALCACLLLFPFVGRVLANQVHYRDTTFATATVMVMAELLAPANAEHEIVVRVLKVWTNPRLRVPTSAFTLGEPATVKLRSPPVITDRRRSPLIERYWDVAAALPAVHQRLLLVGDGSGDFEPTTYSKAKEAKLELFSRPDELARAIKNKPEDALIADYPDLDLRALVIEALRARKVSLLQILRGQLQQNAFLALLQENQNAVLTGKNAAFVAPIVDGAATLSVEQRDWLGRWMNNNLYEPANLPLKIQLFSAITPTTQQQYEQQQVLHGEVYRNLDDGALMDAGTLARFTELFLRLVEKFPARIGQSLNGSMVEKLMQRAPSEAHRIRMRFVRALVAASHEQTLVTDPEHLIVYFLVSHLRQAKDAAATTEFCKIDFTHPAFAKYRSYAVELAGSDPTATQALAASATPSAPAADVVRHAFDALTATHALLSISVAGFTAVQFRADQLHVDISGSPTPAQVSMTLELVARGLSVALPLARAHLAGHPSAKAWQARGAHIDTRARLFCFSGRNDAWTFSFAPSGSSEAGVDIEVEPATRKILSVKPRGGGSR